MIARLASYDSAVATQAASLLRARAPADFEGQVRSMIQVAPPHVAKGLRAYLDGWEESRRQVVRGKERPN
jgi:hypothetical protein